MGNENKIGKSGESRELFLREGAMIGVTESEVYSLEDEFAKTKKNKNVGLIMLVILFIAIMGGGAYLGSLLIQQKSEQVDVDITDFEDINLREILASAQSDEAKLKVLRADLSDLRKEQQKDIIKAKDRTANEIELVMNRNLSPDERKKRVAKIKVGENRRINIINEKYEKKTSKKEEQIESLENKIALLDKETMHKAQQSEEALNNYNKLFKLKEDKLRAQHKRKLELQAARHKKELVVKEKHYKKLTKVLILKFNPKYKSKEINAILADSSGSDNAKLLLRDYDTAVAPYNVSERVKYSDIRTRIKNNSKLIKRLADTPYINSVPIAIDKINFLYTSIVLDYQKLWLGLVDTIKRQDTLIKHYDYAFNSYSVIDRANGYILDARNNDTIVVFVEKLYSPKDGDEALVYRKDKYIAKIKVYPKFDRVQATIVELADGEKIQSLDKILFILDK